jgi:acetyl esterase/lipase
VLVSVVAALAVLAGCGGSGTPAAAKVVERSYGSGAQQVWTFSPESRTPASLVVFLHGLGGVQETTPALHRPWLRHLAENGNVVVYPRYEVRPGEPGGLEHAIDGIRLAASKAGAGDAPVVLIGYSRGGGMAVEYTGVARAVGVVPKAVLGVFPALLDPVLDLSVVQPKTRFVFLVGDKDISVGYFGANRLVDQLQAAGYPEDLVSEEVVHSTKDFQATHLSVLEDSPGARAAFWDRADALIAAVVEEP